MPNPDLAVTADTRWMALAVAESRRCPPSSSAFSVGAIIVDQAGNEVARGYSREGDAHTHAEEAAVAKVGGMRPRLVGATLYSSLEPCTERRSRPLTCTALVLASGIGRVVIAWREPALLVADCRGVETLRAAGVQVVEMPEFAAEVMAVNAHLGI